MILNLYDTFTELARQGWNSVPELQYQVQTRVAKCLRTVQPWCSGKNFLVDRFIEHEVKVKKKYPHKRKLYHPVIFNNVYIFLTGPREDWNCGKNRSRQVQPVPGSLQDHWTFWWHNCDWQPGCDQGWPPGSQVKAHNHSTGKHLCFLYNHKKSIMILTITFQNGLKDLVMLTSNKIFQLLECITSKLDYERRLKNWI